MDVLIPDEKSLVLLIKKIFWLVQDAAAYHLGPVAPPRTYGASLKLSFILIQPTLKSARSDQVPGANLFT